jgi:hypothetical protein
VAVWHIVARRPSKSGGNGYKTETPGLGTKIRRKVGKLLRG